MSIHDTRISSAAQSDTSHHDSPYVVTAPLQILAIMRELQSKKPLIRMQVADSPITLVTTVLDVDRDRNAIVLDNAQNDVINKRLIEAEKIRFETALDKVQIQFQGTKLDVDSFEGHDALLMPMPSELTRLQRRDFYRIDTPVNNPVLCRVPVKNQKSTELVNLRLDDISGGGVGLLDDNQTLGQVNGMLLRDCTIELPEVGAIRVSLRVRHCIEQRLPNGNVTQRLGCAFVNPDKTVQNLVQRYIGRLERDMNAKRSGFAE